MLGIVGVRMDDMRRKANYLEMEDLKAPELPRSAVGFHACSCCLDCLRSACRQQRREGACGLWERAVSGKTHCEELKLNLQACRRGTFKDLLLEQATVTLALGFGPPRSS